MALWHVSIPGLVSGLKTAASASEAEAAVRALSGVGVRGVASVAEAIGGHCFDPHAIQFDSVAEVVPSKPIAVVEVVVNDTSNSVTEVVDVSPSEESLPITEVVTEPHDQTASEAAPQAVAEVIGGTAPPFGDS